MIDALNYRLIESDQLLTFGKAFNQIFAGFDETRDPYILAPFVKRCVTTYTEFSKAFEREATNPFTGKLRGADSQRDGAFLGYRSFIESCTHDDDSVVKEAAVRLLAVIVKHGWSAHSFGYKKQTAAITKIINETRDFYLADVQTAGATAKFNLMETRQTAFEKLQNDSVTREPSGLPTLLETRPNVIFAIRKLINVVDCHYSEKPDDEQLKGYVNAINELITLTMSTARAAQTREENQKKDTGTKPQSV